MMFNKKNEMVFQGISGTPSKTEYARNRSSLEKENEIAALVDMATKELESGN